MSTIFSSRRLAAAATFHIGNFVAAAIKFGFHLLFLLLFLVALLLPLVFPLLTLLSLLSLLLSLLSLL